MSAIAASLRSLALSGGGAILPRPNRRARVVALAVLAAGLLLLLRPDLLPVMLTGLSDAYLQVGVFVAGTLMLVAWSERASGIDVAAWLAPGSPWRLGAAALLGALPGCGGAVVVVTRYVAGRTTFGAFVAVLTATMGDAAFLLLAREPVTGLAMVLLGLGAGILTGFAAERLLPDWKAGRALPEGLDVTAAPAAATRPQPLTRLWHGLLVPGAVFAVLGTLQVDLEAVPGLASLALGIGVAGALLAIALWVAADPAGRSGQADAGPAGDTAMVTVWVIAAFLLFGLVSQGLGLDVAGLFDTAWMVLPLLGVLVGFLPGCGPQIVVASFYLSGVLPVSALAANAISNDGDALFPALALAPRAALAASVVTAIPALAVGYGLHMALPAP